ncbi:hypothetical protein O3M35_011678 [Rhynocoris fuscipes]|uniref:RNase NYN domain-containing protein n=1 Tax=Rhynocoris fuscipes TaxID=488301 RepID=A0AAW1CZE5_9HEMI
MVLLMDVINLDDTGDTSESGLSFCHCTQSTPMSPRRNKPRRITRRVRKTLGKGRNKNKRALNGLVELLKAKTSTANQENTLCSTLNGAQLDLDKTIDNEETPSSSLCNRPCSSKNSTLSSEKKRKRSRSNNKSNKVVILDSDDDCVVVSDTIGKEEIEDIQDGDNSVLSLSDSSIIELSDSEDVGVVAGTVETAQTGWRNLKKTVNNLNISKQQSKFDFTNKKNLNVLRHKLRKMICTQNTLEDADNKLPGPSAKQPAPKSKSPTPSHSQSISYLPLDTDKSEKKGLRPIIIDGSNVAFGHGKDKFSSKGIEICIDFFLRRKHEEVRAFIPQFRRRHPSTTNFEILDKLETKGYLIYTPSRLVGNQRITSYDDRFIIEYAAKTGGIVISRDNFQDLLAENPAWSDTIKFRVLQYTFVGDMIMFPKDPLGRGGPTLDRFLMYD